MDSAIVERLKAYGKPVMTQADVPNTAPLRINGKDEWLHHDTQITFPSRSALKKAIRIAHANNRSLRTRNNERLTHAMRRVLATQTIDVRGMVRDELKAIITEAAGKLLGGDVIRMTIRDIVKDEMIKAVIGRRADAGMAMSELVKKYAEAETKKLIAEALTFDITVRGNVHKPASRRALDMHDHDD